MDSSSGDGFGTPATFWWAISQTIVYPWNIDMRGRTWLAMLAWLLACGCGGGDPGDSEGKSDGGEGNDANAGEPDDAMPDVDAMADAESGLTTPDVASGSDDGFEAAMADGG